MSVVDYLSEMDEIENKIRILLKLQKVHRCDVCRTFFSKSVFFILNHVRRHRFPLESFNCEESTFGAYSCRLCRSDFDAIVLLNEHTREEHLVTRNEENASAAYELKSYICRDCSFESYSYLHWFKHVINGCSRWSVLSEEPKIKKLKIINPGRISKRSQQAKSRSKKQFKCEKCAYETTRKALLLQHFNTLHADDENKIWFKCEKCEYKGTQKSYLLLHFNALHADDGNKKWFKCDKCEYKATRKSHLVQHFNARHVDDDDKKWYKCHKCTYKATRKAHLSRHVDATHAEDENRIWFKCDHCSYKAKVKSCLDRHFNSKHAEAESKTWFRCERCAYKATQKVNLQRHFFAKHSMSRK